jgi:outer membrane protein insertion porin family
VFVERIDITGNVRTRDNVIRREFRLVEGDAFNSARLRRSRQRIQDLDFFQKVEVDEVPGSAPDKAVVKVAVEEKSTGQLSFGAGFSSAGGALLDASIRERNLLGRGQDLRLGVVFGQKTFQLDLGFTEPYFLGRDIAAGFDLFHTEVNRQSESSFDSTRTGGALRAGYPITENLRQSWRYTLEQKKVENVDDNASIFVKSQEGEETVSEITHRLTYDKRDSRLDPTKGYYASIATDVAGLGGTVNYVRNDLNAAYYYPIVEQWVVSISGAAGHITGYGGEDVNLIDRFFVGGDDLRGFATDGIGPRDLDSNDALGGEIYYTGSVQMTFPLGLPDELAIRGRVFTDLGSLWKLDDSGPDVADNNSLRASVGIGLTWVSPFGPIGIDLGQAVLKESYDETEIFRVNFGTRF